MLIRHEAGLQLNLFFHDQMHKRKTPFLSSSFQECISFQFNTFNIDHFAMQRLLLSLNIHAFYQIDQECFPYFPFGEQKISIAYFISHLMELNMISIFALRQAASNPTQSIEKNSQAFKRGELIPKTKHSTKFSVCRAIYN